MEYKKYKEKDYVKIKAWRKQIYKETKEIANNNYYFNPNNEKIELAITKEAIEDNFFIDKPDFILK